MTVSTPGLVLHAAAYGEHSMLAHVFTRQLGMRSYIVKGVRSRTGRARANLLQPMVSLDMVVSHNPHRTLGYVSELSLHRPQPDPGHIGNALRFFAAEVLRRSLPEAEPLVDLWDYADQWTAQASGMPADFMLHLASHLGICPMDNYAPHSPYFDMNDGRFVSAPSVSTLAAEPSLLLHSQLDGRPPRSSAERAAVLDALITYFGVHIGSFRNITSHEILHTVLH